MKKLAALAVAGMFTASFAASAFAEAEVKVGGEIRVRDVITNNYDWNDSSNAGDSNNTITSRTRVNVDAKVNETTKAYISLQDTRVWGNSSGSTATTGSEQHAASAADTSESVAVSQAWFQLDKLFDQPLSLKVGRQVLAYGDHRVIGSFEWSNYANRFDALKLIYNTDALSLDLWTAKIVETGSLAANGLESYTATTDRDGYLNGLYATIKGIPSNSVDLYIIQRAEVAGHYENFLTYGARLNGGAAGLDYTLEGAIQSGDNSTDGDQDANMITAMVGYTIPDVLGGLRIGVEFDRASGDDDAADGDTEVWNDLYPTNHPLYGVSNVGATKLSGTNNSGLTAWSANLTAKPAQGLKLRAEYWNFEATEDDLLADDKIGTEINIQAWYALRANVDLHAYYAYFTPDDALTGGGDDDSAENITLMATVKF